MQQKKKEENNQNVIDIFNESLKIILFTCLL